MTLNELLMEIRCPDPDTLRRADEWWNHLAKPLGSLGILENSVTKIAALKEQQIFRLDRATLLVFCADNGVIAQGVSQSDASVTTAVARALGAGCSTVSYMAAEVGCRIVPVNIGMAETEELPGVQQKCIRRGTDDISLGPAMSRGECEAAILAGAELVFEEKQRGTDILLLGEMGIGNTTTSAAAACALLGQEPGVLTGRGAGLSDEGLIRKREAVRQALRVNQPDPADPVDILAKVGGLDLAALCGACLGGAACGIPVLLDGVITCAAALCAVRLCPDCWCALLASHLSREPAAALILKELGLEAPLHADLHLGEGSGAMLSLPLLRQAAAVYQSGHTFEHLGIEAYTQQD